MEILCKRYPNILMNTVDMFKYETRGNETILKTLNAKKKSKKICSGNPDK